MLEGVRKVTTTGVVVSWDSSSPGHLGKTEAASVNKQYVEDAKKRVANGTATNFDHLVAELDPEMLSTGSNVVMPPIILSNKGSEELADNQSGEITSRDPDFLREMAYQLSRALKRHNLPDEVHLNLVYKGGHVGNYYNTRRSPNQMDINHDLHSFQIEYSTGFTHDPYIFTPKPIQLLKLKAAFEEAMYNAYAGFLRG